MGVTREEELFAVHRDETKTLTPPPIQFLSAKCLLSHTSSTNFSFLRSRIYFNNIYSFRRCDDVCHVYGKVLWRPRRPLNFLRREIDGKGKEDQNPLRFSLSLSLCKENKSYRRCGCCARTIRRRRRYTSLSFSLRASTTCRTSRDERYGANDVDLFRLRFSGNYFA